MDPAFWHQRWAAQQIGFHQAQVNPYLAAHWPTLPVAPDSQVLVPLCGKSLDLAWLAAQGHQVVGVELSEQAVAAFFDRHGLTPEVEARGVWQIWRSGALELWCGDFFALQASDVAGCTAFYDRAALIALPVEMRERYLAHLDQLLPVRCEGLLVTLEYDQALIDGPPFSVGQAEVLAGFAGWEVSALEQREIAQESPRFVKAGVNTLLERVYRVSR